MSPACIPSPLPLQVRSFIDGAYQRTVAVLREKKDLVEKMAEVIYGVSVHHAGF